MSGDFQKIVILGTGSIAQRHARLLEGIGHQVTLFSDSRHTLDGFHVCFSLDEAMKEQPQLVIIANATASHEDALKKIDDLGFKGKILVEKPLFSNKSYLNWTSSITDRTYVGYQFRFHPWIQKVRAQLASLKVFSAQVHVGQYLPSWRERDYEKTYSASTKLGGGVLRDLSHELDYLMFLFGPWKRVTAHGGKWSDLKIDAEDTIGVLIEFDRCPMVGLELNYTDRLPKRNIHISCDSLSLEIDFIGNTMRIGDHTMYEEINRDQIFESMHRALLSQEISDLCTFEDGIETLDLILAIEQSIIENRWMTNEKIMHAVC